MKYLLIIMGIYAGIFSVLVIRNHQLYQTFGWDLGFFDQLLWQASRGNLNFVSSFGNINILGDHFQPIIYLLAPLYWIWDDVMVILIAQVLLVTIATVPLFLLAKIKIENGTAALAIAAAYLLFSGAQFTIINEFHQSAFIPLLLAWGLYWLETEKIGRGLAALLSLLLVREEMGLLLAALGVTYWIRKGPTSTYVGVGPLLMTGGIIGFFLLINIVIPAVSSQGQYIHYGYGSLGNKPEEVFISAIKNPGEAAISLISPSAKMIQVFQSIMAFGGLPVLNPVSLIPVFEQYIVRFLDNRNIHRWIDNNHYSAPLGPLLAFGTIMTISFLLRSDPQPKLLVKGGRTLIISLYLIVSAVITAALLKTPIWSIFNPQLYFTPQWVEDADRLVAAVPAGVGVAANNSLAPHLTHRDELYLLPKFKDAEYIAVDLSDGPNKHAPWPAKKMRGFVNELIESGDWEIEQQFGDSLLIKRAMK